MSTFVNKIKCLHPITVVNPKYRSRAFVDSGDIPNQSARDYRLSVPCGKCLLCRKRKANDWHVRLFHEALGTPRLSINNKKLLNILFATFTFSDKYLPDDSNDGLRERIAPFIRHWRDNWRKRHGVSPRYFAVTDIGGDEGRLHLHLLIFNPVDRDGNRISISSIFSTAHRWRKRTGDESPVPPSLQLDWHYGYCTYCSMLKGIEGIHYVIGYLNNSNVIKQLEKGKKVQKHGSPVCEKALKHIPAVFVSQGLGKDFINTNEFSKLKNLKSFICNLGKFRYAVPRYYRSKYFDDQSIFVVDDDGVILSEYLYTSEDQYRAFMSSLMLRLQSDYESADSVSVSLLGHRWTHHRDGFPLSTPWNSVMKSLDEVYGYTPDPPPLIELLKRDSWTFKDFLNTHKNSIQLSFF